MDGRTRNRYSAMALILACAGLAFVTGCAGNGLFAKKANPDASGIMAPSEEIAALREMRETAAKVSPDEQQRRSKLLAKAIRREEDALIRAEILKTLEKYPTETATEVLSAGSRDPDPDVRITVCEVLGHRNDSASVATLGELLNGDSNIDVRLAAARALGESRDPAAVQQLGKALEDPDPAMQYRVVQSLHTVTGKDLGNDANRWRLYVRGELPKSEESISLGERLRRLF